MSERYGDYELIRHIATGGMAEIHLARQRGAGGSERLVVVKRMLPQLAVRADFVVMFQDEARLTATLDHPNIVSVFELGENDGSFFIAMELVDGPHLGVLFAHSLRQQAALPLDLCCWIVARAAAGLHHAHDRCDPSTGLPLQLVHRDISPQNILVGRHGEVKVTDFGVAKASTQQTKTRTGNIKGKVAYMSPEQCMGDVVDRRTDVFALGIVLYELVTRRRLFHHLKSDLLVMQEITTKDIARASTLNSEVDVVLDAIIARALSRSLEARFPSAGDLSAALDGWVAGRANERVLATWFAEHCLELAPSSTSQAGEPVLERLRSSPGAGNTHETTSMTPSVPEGAMVGPLSGPDELEGVATAPSAPLGSHASASAVFAPRASHERDARPSNVPPGPEAGAGLRPEPSASLGPEPATVPSAAQAPSSPSERVSSAPLSTGHASPAWLVEVAGGPGPTPSRQASRGVKTVAAAGIAGLVAVAFALVRDSGAPVAVVEDAAGGAMARPSFAVDAGTPQPPASSPPATTGRLVVTTTPTGVPILAADSRVLGKSPLDVALPPGPLRLQAQFADQPPRAAEVVINRGETTTAVIDALVPLVVRTTPPGAKVRVDGQLRGETPFDQGFLVEPGKPFALRLERPGFVVWEQSRTAVAGEPLLVELALTNASSSPVSTRAEWGAIRVNADPWAVVKLGGQVLGEAPFSDKRVPAGKQQLTLTNPELGLSDSFSVTVPPNQTLVVIVRYEKKGATWALAQKTIR